MPTTIIAAAHIIPSTEIAQLLGLRSHLVLEVRLFQSRRLVGFIIVMSEAHIEEARKMASRRH